MYLFLSIMASRKSKITIGARLAEQPSGVVRKKNPQDHRVVRAIPPCLVRTVIYIYTYIIFQRGIYYNIYIYYVYAYPVWFGKILEIFQKKGRFVVLSNRLGWWSPDFLVMDHQSAFPLIQGLAMWAIKHPGRLGYIGDYTTQLSGD